MAPGCTKTPRGPLRLAFLHCNARHHSIAFIGAPDPKKLNHIMFESNALTDVGIGRDLCLASNIPFAIDLGCHMNERMVSGDLESPSGFALEYGWGARVVDDATWQIEYYDSIDSIGGHPQLSRWPPEVLRAEPVRARRMAETRALAGANRRTLRRRACIASNDGGEAGT